MTVLKTIGAADVLRVTCASQTMEIPHPLAFVGALPGIRRAKAPAAGAAR